MASTEGVGGFPAARIDKRIRSEDPSRRWLFVAPSTLLTDADFSISRHPALREIDVFVQARKSPLLQAQIAVAENYFRSVLHNAGSPPQANEIVIPVHTLDEIREIEMDGISLQERLIAAINKELGHDIPGLSSKQSAGSREITPVFNKIPKPRPGIEDYSQGSDIDLDKLVAKVKALMADHNGNFNYVQFQGAGLVQLAKRTLGGYKQTRSYFGLEDNPRGRPPINRDAERGKIPIPSPRSPSESVTGGKTVYSELDTHTVSSGQVSTVKDQMIASLVIQARFLQDHGVALHYLELFNKGGTYREFAIRAQRFIGFGAPLNRLLE